ncbi:unnamed protein product [Dracunculus medinensis]|uniref:Uncharacterized protein n=1 Tax=Dracunculus medinensis TaxID=318479 RepID=A0A3P7PZ06_DRAME|nr:unnamed protein product [Dracunculus medinensis]
MGIILFFIALLLPGWTNIDFINVEQENVHVALGVWGEWRTVMNGTMRRAEWIPHFPNPSETVLRLADADLKHYYRSQMVIGIIALVLMVANNCLAIYSFYHHRYMYKRLTACLHIVIAMCIVIVIEVLSKSINEWNLSVAQQSVDRDWDYSVGQTTGYPSYMAYACVFIYIFAAIAFAVSSHKQKGSRAATAEFEIEDRPIHIGR